MVVKEFTQEEYDLILKFKVFIINNFKEIEKLNLTEEQKVFVLSDTIIDLIDSIREHDVKTFFYIIQTLITKGEKNEQGVSNTKQ